MKRSMFLAGAFLMALTMAACGGDEGPSESPSAAPTADTLDGTTWTLSSMEAASGDVSVPEQARPTIAFEDGQANGFSGCNTFGGTYTVDGSTLELGPVRGTMMACGGDASDIEVAYLEGLGVVDSFSIDADTLTLSGGDSTLVYSAGSPNALIGVTWVVVNLATEDAITGTVEGHAPTIEFGEDGSVSGTDGCNRYFGDYSIDGQSIQIGPLGGTKMACADPDVDQQAIDFASALESAANYEIAGSKLTLTTEEGTIAVVATYEATG